MAPGYSLSWRAVASGSLSPGRDPRPTPQELRSMALRRELAGLAAGLLCLLLPAGTRAESAAVAVTVKDSSGASLAGATVALLDAQRAAVASARADAPGRGSLPLTPRHSL